jgi:DNA (cytosine-5)-methyltransferase 1
LVNTADFGAFQTRKRMVFLGSRDGEDVRLPAPTHSERGGGGLRKWRTLRDAIGSIEEDEPAMLPLQPNYRDLVEHIPAGGNWRDLPEDLQRRALGRAYESWGGRSGFLRRLAWDRPAPALTTRPNSRATMLLHPEEDRVLSVREFAALQGFPKGWRFDGLPGPQYRQIGNAVPVQLGNAVGRALIEVADGGRRRRRARLGVVACADKKLLDAYEARPRTILNPPRMRDGEGVSVPDAAMAAREWTKLNGGGRRDPLPVKVLAERRAA